jgi:hypothetical protein
VTEAIRTEADALLSTYFTYVEYGGGYAVSGVSEEGRKLSALTLPGTYDGKAVLAIERGAFAGCDKLLKVTLSQNTAQLMDGAFADCPNLTMVCLPHGSPEGISVGNGLMEDAAGDIKLVLGSREAFEALKLYQKLYPDSKQIDWVKLKKEAYYDLMAERELELADYYEARGRYEAAKRHLALVLSEYPQSRHTQTAESRLVKLAENYLPGAFPGKRSDGPPKLQVYKVPDEASRVLLLPDDGTENHRLQPVPDLLGAEAVLLPTAAEESEE